MACLDWDEGLWFKGFRVEDRRAIMVKRFHVQGPQGTLKPKPLLFRFRA